MYIVCLFYNIHINCPIIRVAWLSKLLFSSPHISLEPERCFVFVLIAAARVRTLRRKERQGSRCAPCSILLLPSSSPPLGIYCTMFVPFLLPSAASVWRLEIRKNMPYFSVISFCTSERRRWCSWGPRS